MQSLQFFSLVSKSEHNSNALPLQLQRRNVTLKKVARRPTSGCDYCLCWLCFGLKKTIIFRNPLPGVKVTAHGTSQYGTGSLAECIPRAATRKNATKMTYQLPLKTFTCTHCSSTWGSCSHAVWRRSVPAISLSHILAFPSRMLTLSSRKLKNELSKQEYTMCWERCCSVDLEVYLGTYIHT